MPNLIMKWLMAAMHICTLSLLHCVPCRLDSPVWMVSHKVNDTGAFPDLAKGILNVTPRTPVDRQNYNRHEFATEPLLDMWLMYACPYQLNGRVYGCGGRNAAVEATGATFMANERALSFEHGRSQVGDAS